MPPITLMGLSSVLDRTLFTDKGPIVKRPVALLTGSDLIVASDTDVVIPSASFTSANVGQKISISGSYGGRNDGLFTVVSVVNTIRLRLDKTNFDIADHTKTLALVMSLANDFKKSFNLHRTAKDKQYNYTKVHYHDDITNIIGAPDAVDLASTITLLSQMLTVYNDHRMNIGGDYHSIVDSWNVPYYPAPTTLAGAVLLVNELRAKYEAHRLERRIHQIAGMVEAIKTAEVVPVKHAVPGLLTGPFSWVLYDPKLGMIADSPLDVTVNSGAIAVDAVFGMLGAVVLHDKPNPGDRVFIDYDYINNPPARFMRLNSFEFVLNQDKNNGYAGFPGHKYKARSYLIDPSHSPDLMSPFQPKSVGWKYKAFEREYTAALNDANTLMLNSPIHDVKYPVLYQTVGEKVIRYDPITLPQDAKDPWNLEGNGSFALASDGSELTIEDYELQTGTVSKPPFFTYAIDVMSESFITAAFRTRVQSSTPDGIFTGVAFGASDGSHVAMIGFLTTEATGLSSAIAMINDLKIKFNKHVVEPTVHDPYDVTDQMVLVDATSEQSLIILVNYAKQQFNKHLAKADPSGVTLNIHKLPDTVNPILTANATDLSTAVALVNELRIKYESHRLSTIHFVTDKMNVADLTKQIGILTNRGPQEFAENWVTHSVDWSTLKTYRLHRDPSGDVSIYLSGDMTPLATVLATDLPAISDFDGRFDPIQQMFFGSVSREAISDSRWGLVLVDVSPVDTNLIEDNKAVQYSPIVVPELDPVAPWITVGNGGIDRIGTWALAPSLMLDSTCSARIADTPALGKSSGAYRGFMRFEPILKVYTACVIEFEAVIDYHTSGIDNRTVGVFMDDGELATHFAFLYYAPTPAVAVGINMQPFGIVHGDTLILSLDDQPVVVVTFPVSTPMTAVQVAAVINAAVGFALADDDGAGHVRLTYGSGTESRITIFSGSILPKIGMSIRKYFGVDSNPEPRVSWFGENLPDLESVAWQSTGGTYSSATMLGRTMRLDDASSLDYLSYEMAIPVVTTTVLKPTDDWKLDFRIAVQSYTPGDAVPTVIPYVPLNFSGALVSVNEGMTGKHVELHLAVDSVGSPFINMVSYNTVTGALDVMAQYAFSWNDQERHTINLYTNKTVDQLFVYVDGILLSPTAGPIPTYTGLRTGTGLVPSLIFGSGGEAVVGADMRTSMSVVDWESVAVFHDSKLVNPTLAAASRYVGLYKGGDPTRLSSWYRCNVDWSNKHNYRIVRSPQDSIAVYLDGGDIPVISVSYDVLTFPPSSSSFLRDMSDNRPVIAFGSFNPQELARSRWDSVKYSIGKFTLTDRIVPPHHVLNWANVIASPEHTQTQLSHEHRGFSIYSGGTPTDDFMSELDQAYTILGEGTPPVPMTQNLESRGGMVKTVTPINTIDAVNLVDYRGFLGNYEDDVVNVVTIPYAPTTVDATSAIIDVANNMFAAYGTHLSQPSAVMPFVHVVNDVVNVPASPIAVDLPSSIVRLNDLRTTYNAHLTSFGIHDPNDVNDGIVSAPAADLPSAIRLSNEFVKVYDTHRSFGRFHGNIFLPPLPLPPAVIPKIDDPNPVAEANATDDLSSMMLADGIRTRLIAHVTSDLYHLAVDSSVANMGHIVGLGIGKVKLGPTWVPPPPIGFNTVFDSTLTVFPGDVIQFHDGINAGIPVTVVQILSSASFIVHPPLVNNDYVGSRFSKMNGINPILNVTSVIALANEVRLTYDKHRMSASHSIKDTRYPTVAGLAHDRATAWTLLNDVKARFNQHISGRLHHADSDLWNTYSHSIILDPVDAAIVLTNETQRRFNDHLHAPRVHIENGDIDVVATIPAFNLASLILLVNAMKTSFNAHAVRSLKGRGIHVRDDTVNTVILPDAFDVDSAVALANGVAQAYENHRTQIVPGFGKVHGSTVFIRLDPPSGVLYECMKFWKLETGVEGLVFPFSDDDDLW